MPFSTQVGLGPGDIVLDGDPALPAPMERVTAAPSRIHQRIQDLVRGVCQETWAWKSRSGVHGQKPSGGSGLGRW